MVIGGQDFHDKMATTRVLDAFQRDLGISSLGHGGGSGADHLADAWARAHGVNVEVHQGARSGNRAADANSSRLLLEGHKPDQVIAFPGDRKTKNCIKQARDLRIPVWEPLAPDEGQLELPSPVSVPAAGGDG